MSATPTMMPLLFEQGTVWLPYLRLRPLPRPRSASGAPVESSISMGDGHPGRGLALFGELCESGGRTVRSRLGCCLGERSN